MSYKNLYEYVWIDGTTPTAQLRSKIRVTNELIQLNQPGKDWSFDGSSTSQAEATQSDCVLRPFSLWRHPFIADGNLLFCEVLNADGTPHASNHRFALKESVSDPKVEGQEPWVAFEQEYVVTSLTNAPGLGRPIGFPQTSLPGPQGPYYCGVGPHVAFGRQIAEKHLKLCLDIGLDITGINGEVMPGQWEFQIGGPSVSPLQASDQLWIARWILLRLSEEMGVGISFDPKHVEGDWNGSGCHTNFSTNEMRDVGGISAIIRACELLGNEDRIKEHLDVYGHGIERRLTGHHETCSHKNFYAGIADRTASIRIPAEVERRGAGYLEDRRPNANCDPYLVSKAIVDTVCLEVGVKPHFRKPQEVGRDGRGTQETAEREAATSAA